jgi:hypothetical protein
MLDANAGLDERLKHRGDLVGRRGRNENHPSVRLRFVRREIDRNRCDVGQHAIRRAASCADGRSGLRPHMPIRRVHHDNRPMIGAGRPDDDCRSAATIVFQLRGDFRIEPARNRERGQPGFERLRPDGAVSLNLDDATGGRR